ncbi:GyrI-like domain-containing protein [Enterococcus sp. LJL128]
MKIYEIDSVRANNFSEDVGQKIGYLWQQTMTKIEPGEVVYAVYHEYAGDFTADYTLSLAVEKAEKGKELVLDDGTYKAFPVVPSSTGFSQDNVLQAWQEIWALEKAGKLKRRYEKDFEKYEADDQVCIYISVY